MSIQILMPALSPTMEEGKLAKWLVKEGDEVHSGDILAEIETDKATMEFEAVDEGRIGKILVPEGTEGVKVNQPIAELVAKDRETPAERRSGMQSPAAQQKLQAISGTPHPAGSAVAREPAVARPQVEFKTPPARKSSEVGEPHVPAGTELVTMTVREAL